MKKKSIYSLTLDQLTDWLIERGYTKYRALRIWDWLYRKRVTDFFDMLDIKSECIQLLADHFIIHSLNECVKQESTDGTIKFLYKLQDDHVIETVMMKHKYGISVCVTTQVGCNMGCSFCASGLLGKSRDLSCGEMVEQVINIQLHLDKMGNGDMVSHVVVMGIGEPFDNFTNMLHFLEIIMDHRGVSIAGRCITVSTSGLADKIYELADLMLPVNLAISLHAPNNRIRTRIMKINRTLPIEKLMEALAYYVKKTNRRLTIEYIMLKDVNDHKNHALELAYLLKDIKHKAYVNLIPYNPVGEMSQYKRSDKESVLSFYDSLKKEDINCKIRQEHGTDIDAACGQLRNKQIKRE